MWTPAISMPGTKQHVDGSYLGLPQLQHHSLGQHTTQAQCRSNGCCINGHKNSLKPPLAENLHREALYRVRIFGTRTYPRLYADEETFGQTRPNGRLIGAILNLSQLPVPQIPPQIPLPIWFQLKCPSRKYVDT